MLESQFINSMEDLLPKCIKCKWRRTLYSPSGRCLPHYLRGKYSGMVERCNSHTSYKNISVLISCGDFVSWGMATLPVGLKIPSIDRIDNGGNYEIDNMRWIENPRNSRKANRDLPINEFYCRACGEVFPISLRKRGSYCKPCDQFLQTRHYYQRKARDPKQLILC